MSTKHCFLENRNVDEKYTLLFFLFVIYLFFSCTKYEKKDMVEIPIMLENGRVVIEADVHGKKGRFVFDTGTTESYVDVSAKNLFPSGYCWTQYNSHSKLAFVYALNKITVGGTEIHTRSWLINRSDIITKRLKEGYDGLLGTRIFEGYWCELAFSKNKIILYKEKPDHFTMHTPVTIPNKYDADFYIPVVIDGREYYFDVDTGAPNAIYHPDGIIAFKKADEYSVVLADEEIKEYHIIKTNSIRIFDETYDNMSVISNSVLAKRHNYKAPYNERGLLGLNFLKYYDFLFDYRELYKGKSTGLYYKPNTPLEDRNYGFFSFLKKVPEFGVLNFGIDDSGLIIISVIQGSLAYEPGGLRPGMVITKVNGKPVNEYTMEEVREPDFYLRVTDYTVLENGIERTIISPFKE